jgi:hypothetical protein
LSQFALLLKYELDVLRTNYWKGWFVEQKLKLGCSYGGDQTLNNYCNKFCRNLLCCLSLSWMFLEQIIGKAGLLNKGSSLFVGMGVT